MCSSYSIVNINESSEENIHLWNDCIQRNNLPPQIIYEWAIILKEVFCATVYTLMVLDGKGRPCGLALLYKTKGSNVLYSCRHGFFAENNAIAQVLSVEINSIAKRDGLTKSVITSGVVSFDVNEKLYEKESLYIPLAYSDVESLWLSIPKKTKNMIRKAEKNGITVTKDWSYLKDFYNVYTERFSQKSLSIKPYSLFERIRDTFGEDAVFLGALLNGKIVAGMIFVANSHGVSYAYNGSDLTAGSSGANNLLMWEAMQHFYNSNKSYIDLSESQNGSLVYKFKTRLSKDIQCKAIHYYDFLTQMHLEQKMSSSLFLKYKIRGVLHRLMPIMPQFIKLKYFKSLGKEGRVL